jgi:hypothetical protein
MTILVNWDNAEKTTILYTIHGRWTWEDLYAALNEGRGMMDSVSHDKVDFIVDMTDCKLLPENALSHFARMTTKPHLKNGRMVMAGATTFVRALLNVLGRYQGANENAKAVKAVPTLAEARSIITAYRQLDAQNS